MIINNITYSQTLYHGQQLSEIRMRLLDRIGSEALLPEDCSKMSIAIFLETGHYISQSTITRLFGVLSDQTGLTPFVKNVISNFLGFTNWNELTMDISKNTCLPNRAARDN